MSWRDNLREATFRGVAFKVEGHEAEGGRRAVQHEYPLRDTPYVEDLGRKARRWSVEAYVLGAAYMDARDKLLDALEQSGPGTLVHPYLGTRAAQVETYRLRETTREGGMARISIVFLEPGRAAAPDASANTAWAVDNAATDARGAATDQFDRVFDCSGRPEWIRTSALAKVQEAIDQVRLAASRLTAGKSSIFSLADALAAAASGLIATPSSLASGLDGLVYSLCGTESPADSALSASLSLASALATSTAATATENRAQEQANANAVVDLVRASALAAAAVACSQTDFACRDDAVAARDSLVDALDAAAASAPDAVYQTLTDLRVAVARDVSANGADLASLTAYTPAATTPALVLAHRIYGDASRADEIVSRNKVSRPGAVPGGQALEVLADVQS